MEKIDGKTVEMDMAALNAGGFVETSVEELLGLSPEEVYVIDLRIALAKAVRERRVAAGLSQKDVAKKMGSSQSRMGRWSHMARISRSIS